MEIVLFGYVTRKESIKTNPLLEIKEVVNTEGQVSIKQKYNDLVTSLIEIEDNFSGKLLDEIIIDPLAIYVEL
jgi:hypothetical protein